jgi:hypothetical protein
MDKITKNVWSWFSGNSNILKFLLSPVRFTKCLGIRVPLRPPRKKLSNVMHVRWMPGIRGKWDIKLTLGLRGRD